MPLRLPVLPVQYLPFYHWLPDNLAYIYSKFSPRENFYRFNVIDKPNPTLFFYRLGRGFSYHEFELAFDKQMRDLNVLIDLNSYLEKRILNPIAYLKKLVSLDRRYQRLLKQMYPCIQKEFLTQDLNVIIQKN